MDRLSSCIVALLAAVAPGVERLDGMFGRVDGDHVRFGVVFGHGCLLGNEELVEALFDGLGRHALVRGEFGDRNPGLVEIAEFKEPRQRHLRESPSMDVLRLRYGFQVGGVDAQGV
ncbi:hypothetical protein [Bacillus mobilis]